MSKTCVVDYDSITLTKAIDFKSAADCKKHFYEMSSYFQSDGVRLLCETELTLLIEYKLSKADIVENYIKEKFEVSKT